MHSTKHDTPVDRLIRLFDTGLRILTRTQACVHRFPVNIAPNQDLSPADAQKSAQLMRVNHTGEVCAQGLYLGQALVSRDPEVRQQLLDAAEEELAHLSWCKTRLTELESSESVLVSFFYCASVKMGVFTALMGDKISLGFVEATEDEVCKHIERHLNLLPASDDRTRTILNDILEDENRHGKNALAQGGVKFPRVLRAAMTLVSKVMTETTRHF